MDIFKYLYAFGFEWFEKSEEHLTDYRRTCKGNPKEEIDIDDENKLDEIDMNIEIENQNEEKQIEIELSKTDGGTQTTLDCQGNQYDAYINKYSMATRKVVYDDQTRNYYELKEIEGDTISFTIRKSADVYEGMCNCLRDYTLARLEKDVYNDTIDSASFVSSLSCRSFHIVEIGSLKIQEYIMDDAMRAYHYAIGAKSKGIGQWSDTQTFNEIRDFRRYDQKYSHGRFDTTHFSEEELYSIDSFGIWSEHAKDNEQSPEYAIFCMVSAEFNEYSRSNAGIERINKKIKIKSIQCAKQLQQISSQAFVGYNSTQVQKYWACKS